MSDKIKIYVWPDNSYVLADEYDESECAWKGDDFKLVEVDFEVLVALEMDDGKTGEKVPIGLLDI